MNDGLPLLSPTPSEWAAQVSNRLPELVADHAFCEQQAALTANYGIGNWWGSLTAAGKTWTVVGILVGGAIVASAFDSDDSETNASEDMLGK